MKKRILVLLATLLVIVMAFTACSDIEGIIDEFLGSVEDTDDGGKKPGGSGTVSDFDLSIVPEYDGVAYYIINNNQPFFKEEEIVTSSYERYDDVDPLGRCTLTMACLGKDLMPTGKREGDLPDPTGWKQAKYDIISGKYLYNRCHLIGWQLTGEMDNKRNLITGTKYFNISGMVGFENQTADYIKETENHVMYRVTPIFKGEELVARGILMEIYSVEDEGEGLCYNLFIYNVQPGIIIDYETGASRLCEKGEDENSPFDPNASNDEINAGNNNVPADPPSENEGENNESTNTPTDPPSDEQGGNNSDSTPPVQDETGTGSDNNENPSDAPGGSVNTPGDTPSDTEGEGESIPADPPSGDDNETESEPNDPPSGGENEGGGSSSDTANKPAIDTPSSKWTDITIGGETIPEYSGNPYYIVNNNLPFFTNEEKVSESYEYYAPLDSLGRCTYVMACIGKDLMPTGDREGDLPDPSGWKQATYSIVSGRYLYNRCHLIGWQLTGEMENRNNLITGTKYFNISGMVGFENQTADYIKETNNHVMYRVTPVFNENELVARGILMEIYSVEDEGEELCYNVFIYNVQPGIIIDYADGTSCIHPDFIEPEQPEVEESKANYIAHKSTHKIHYPDCGSVKAMSDSNKVYLTMTHEELENAIENGEYSACMNCNPLEKRD